MSVPGRYSPLFSRQIHASGPFGSLLFDLQFHNGQSVTLEDVVASITRWMANDSLGMKLKTALISFQPDGERGFSMVLKQPFPFLLLALSSTGGTQVIIMRRHDAEDNPSKPITTTIGSGPFRFLPEKYIAGVGAAWARNPDYVPRAEPPDGLAGGKVVKLDRVEMLMMPDSSTCANALKQGEIDFVDQLPADMVPLLQAGVKLRRVHSRRLGFIRH